MDDSLNSYMKRFLLSIVTLFAIAGVSKAQSALSVPDITLPQNSTATLTVNFQFDVADTYTGYSFNLELPDDLEFVMAEGTDVACTKGACHDASHSVTANLSEGLVKVAGLSLSSKPLTGTSGVLLTFTVKPKSAVTVGQTFTGTIKDILIVPVEGTKQNLSASTFTVTIGEPADLRTILDETSTTAPEAATGVDVRVKRTVNANVWSTICLPFAMSEAQVKAAFGDDVQLGDFNGYETEEDGEGNITSIAVKFVDATAIEANHPYIIKVSAPVTEFTADGVDIDPEEEPTKAAVKRTKKQWSEMIGTYVANTPVGDADADGWCLFLSGGKFWYSKGTTKMKAYRAYFDFYDVLTEVEEGASARMYISFDPATGIEKTEVTGSAEGVYYDLQGRKVMNPVKGMFIKDHKKVIVK